MLYSSALPPKAPRGWLLPRDSTTLVAMGTAPRIHQGLGSQGRLQAWWHLLGPGVRRLLAEVLDLLTDQRGPPQAWAPLVGHGTWAWV